MKFSYRTALKEDNKPANYRYKFFQPPPPIKHDLNWAYFCETHNNPINFCGNLLYLILRTLIYNVQIQDNFQIRPSRFFTEITITQRRHMDTSCREL